MLLTAKYTLHPLVHDLFYYLFMCVGVHILMHAHGPAHRSTEHLWKSEDIFSESVHVLHHVVPGTRTHVIRLGGKCFYPVCHLMDPLNLDFDPISWLYTNFNLYILCRYSLLFFSYTAGESLIVE